MGRNSILRLWSPSEQLAAGCGDFPGFWTLALCWDLKWDEVLVQSFWETRKLSKMSRQ